MSLYTHERAPDAAGVKRRAARIVRQDDGILLTEIRKILGSDINIPTLEAAGNLSIEKRIYRSAAVLVEKVAVFILQILHEVIHAA